VLRPGYGCTREPCKIRYLVTPTCAILRRNGRSRRIDRIFTIVNEPPRLRELPRHPRLLDASRFTQTAGAVGFLAAFVTAGPWVCRVCPGWAPALEPCKIRYLVTPTCAILRRNCHSRSFDCIFTIVKEPPRLRELPRHPRLLDASQMPSRYLINAVWVLALGSFSSKVFYAAQVLERPRA